MKNIRLTVLMLFCIITGTMKAQQYISVYCTDDTYCKFLLEDIKRIHHEPVSGKTYTFEGVEYPVPVHTFMTDGTLYWANLNVGAMHEFDPGLRLTKSQVEAVLEAIGDDWRLPTKSEIEELMHITMCADDGNKFCVMGDDGEYQYIICSPEDCMVQILSADHIESRLPFVAESVSADKKDDASSADMEFSFFSRLDENSSDTGIFSCTIPRSKPSEWSMVWSDDESDATSYIRLVSEKPFHKDEHYYVVIEQNDGSFHKFDTWNLKSVKQEYLDDSEDCYMLDGLRYPMFKEVEGMSTKGLKWANMNVGAMSEKELGCGFTIGEIQGVLDAVGNGWRLPTKEDFEDLLNVTYQANGEGCYSTSPEVFYFDWSEVTYFERLSTDKRDAFTYIVSRYGDGRLPIYLTGFSEFQYSLGLWSQFGADNDDKYALDYIMYGINTYNKVRNNSTWKAQIRLVKD